MKVVVILPTYNERENIIPLLEKLISISKEIKNHEFKFLVIDDNSPDGTQKIVLQYCKQHPYIYLITGKKEGLGKALLRGLTYAVNELNADILLQMDADLSHDPIVIPEFIKAIDSGADFVVGSRYIAGGSIPQNWGIHRKIFSIVGNAIVRFGLGYPLVHDWTGGFRAYKRQFFNEIKQQLIPFSGYVFQIAFLHKSIVNGAKVAEVPIIFTDRRFGRSKIAPLEYILKILEYVIRSRITSFVSSSFSKFLIVGTIGFIINTVVLELMVKAGFHPTIGSIIGAELAIISNFVLNNSWTFRQRKISQDQLVKKFIVFNTTSIGAIIIQAGAIAIGTWVYGREVYRNFYLLGVIIGLFWNYTMYSKIIWRHKIN